MVDIAVSCLAWWADGNHRFGDGGQDCDGTHGQAPLKSRRPGRWPIFEVTRTSRQIQGKTRGRPERESDRPAITPERILPEHRRNTRQQTRSPQVRGSTAGEPLSRARRHTGRPREGGPVTRGSATRTRWTIAG